MSDYTFNDGLTFGQSQTLANGLNYFATTSFASNVAGPFTNQALPSNVVLQRCGNIVSLSAPQTFYTGNGTAAIITFSATIPSGFRPANPVASGVLCLSNAVQLPGQVQLANSGSIQIDVAVSAANGTQGNAFTSSTSANGTGFAAFCTTYSVT